MQNFVDSFSGGLRKEYASDGITVQVCYSQNSYYQGHIDSPKGRRGHAPHVGLLYAAKFKRGNRMYYI